MRINQFIAASLNISRRNADKFIEGGNVEVEGEIAQLGQKLDGSEKVRVFQDEQWLDIGQDQEAIQKSPNILFYKPIFTVTTNKDPQKRKTIYDVLPRVYSTYKTAGRLDYMSEGLLILSRDGDLIQRMTHPSYETEKTYLVAVRNRFDEEQIKAMTAGGLQIDGYALRPVKVSPCTLSILKEYSYLKLEKNYVWYKFILKEGRNNQIRRMCEVFGRDVMRLIRIGHGQYRLSEALYKKKFMLI
jgi:23S rRNA pseudouridine2605 synthase